MVFYTEKFAIYTFKLVYDVIFILWKIQEMGRKIIDANPLKGYK